jgi:hypothetical protein
MHTPEYLLLPPGDDEEMTLAERLVPLDATSEAEAREKTPAGWTLYTKVLPLGAGSFGGHVVRRPTHDDK